MESVKGTLIQYATGITTMSTCYNNGMCSTGSIEQYAWGGFNFTLYCVGFAILIGTALFIADFIIEHVRKTNDRKAGAVSRNTPVVESTNRRSKR